MIDRRQTERRESRASTPRQGDKSESNIHLGSLDFLGIPLQRIGPHTDHPADRDPLVSQGRFPARRGSASAHCQQRLHSDNLGETRCHLRSHPRRSGPHNNRLHSGSPHRKDKVISTPPLDPQLSISQKRAGLVGSQLQSGTTRQCAGHSHHPPRRRSPRGSRNHHRRSARSARSHSAHRRSLRSPEAQLLHRRSCSRGSSPDSHRHSSLHC